MRCHRIGVIVPLKYQSMGTEELAERTPAQRIVAGRRSHFTRVARADPRRADQNLRRFD